MRLRTEMVDFHGRMLPRTGAHVAHFPLEHDAACAHALMQAMEEAGDVVFYADDDYQHWVYARADSIMLEWGFDSGEAE